jgi:hypothetical protein
LSSATSGNVDDRVAGVCVEASRSEQSGADIAGPERVTAAPVCRAEAFGLAKRMDREPSVRANALRRAKPLPEVPWCAERPRMLSCEMASTC